MCAEVDPIEPVSRDPNDDRILACASMSRADYLVTGGEDLLVVKQYGAPRRSSPREISRVFLGIR